MGGLSNVFFVAGAVFPSMEVEQTEQTNGPLVIFMLRIT